MEPGTGIIISDTMGKNNWFIWRRFCLVTTCYITIPCRTFDNYFIECSVPTVHEVLLKTSTQINVFSLIACNTEYWITVFETKTILLPVCCNIGRISNVFHSWHLQGSQILCYQILCIGQKNSQKFLHGNKSNKLLTDYLIQI